MQLHSHDMKKFKCVPVNVMSATRRSKSFNNTLVWAAAAEKNAVQSEHNTQQIYSKNRNIYDQFQYIRIRKVKTIMQYS